MNDGKKEVQSFLKACPFLKSGKSKDNISKLSRAFKTKPETLEVLIDIASRGHTYLDN